MAQQESEIPLTPVSIPCAGCGMVHDFPSASAARQVWCSGCGELIDDKDGVRRKTAIPSAIHEAKRNSASPLREVPRRASRPISVHVALLAGLLAVFMEILAGLAAVIAIGGFMPLFFLFNPWWFFLLVWLGLLFRSRRAARCAIAGGAIAAFLLGNFTLQTQIVMWGADPPWPDLVWGTLRVIFRSLPLLVMVLALGTRSAREYYNRCDD
jgi:hypothetical protein